ncbi:MAG: iron chelate uptake ABC transporter family permease subunit [Promicromonosporaceae bacterium]|nr:iron chelate uptake ABC transporter family permease subunit [Promicromonosporaceae bacterium]
MTEPLAVVEPAKTTRLWVLAGSAVLVASVIVAVTIGPAEISITDVWRSIASNLCLGEGRCLSDVFGLESLPRLRDAMVWDVRLPRVLTAAAVGGGLAICGMVMQSLTRNPLADPYLLGLSSGASLGAVSVLLLGLSVAGVAVAQPVAAFGGAMAALALTLLLTTAAGRGTLSPARTVLAGLAVGQLAAAATSFVIFWSVRGDQAREVLAWLMGSIAGATWASVAVALGATLVIGTALAFTGRTLDAFAFGDTAAAALGVNVQRTRWTLLIGVAVLTGALVSQSGSIGFIGLVIPHAVRLLVGAQHRALLPLCALAGASILVWADTLARTVFAPRELPVGILTAALGAPVFAALLLRNRSVK